MGNTASPVTLSCDGLPADLAVAMLAVPATGAYGRSTDYNPSPAPALGVMRGVGWVLRPRDHEELVRLEG